VPSIKKGGSEFSILLKVSDAAANQEKHDSNFVKSITDLFRPRDSLRLHFVHKWLMHYPTIEHAEKFGMKN